MKAELEKIDRKLKRIRIKKKKDKTFEDAFIKTIEEDN